MAAPSYHKTAFTGTSDPAGGIITLIETDLTAAGWTFVEQASFTQAATARYMRVWKCPSTLNAAGVDFHIGLVKNQAAGIYIAARAFEGYTAAADTIQRPCVVGSATGNPATPGYIGSAADFALDNSATPAFTELLPTNALVVSTNYDVAVLASRSYLVINVQAAGSTTMGLTWLLGLFDPVYTDSQVTYPPLVALDLRANAATGVSGVSRTPRVAAGPNAFGAFATPESLPFGLYTGAVAEVTSGIVRVVRVALVGVGATAGFTGAGAAYRGKLYDVIAAPLGTSTTALKVGDTLTIGGTVYTALGSSAGVIWATGTVGYFFNTAMGS